MNNKKQFDMNLIDKIFKNSKTIDGENPNLWRLDKWDSIIYRPAYEDIYSKYGWSIYFINGNENDHSFENLEVISFKNYEKIINH